MKVCLDSNNVDETAAAAGTGGGCGAGSDKFKPDLIESKEVIIIGNGPSAITLSFILSGRWPYYLPSREHPIDYLHNRLVYCTTTTTTKNDGNEEQEEGVVIDGRKSLLECDLDYLSNGLTGRSLNRLSILFDQLQNPNVDFGGNDPTTLEWVHRPERKIDHLVLGTGLPGGIWYKLAKHRRFKNILTVSRKKWMQLPDLDIPSDDDDEDGGNSVSSHNRITFQSASEYYRNYVQHFELGQYFRNHTRVVGVEWSAELNCFVIDALVKNCVNTQTSSFVASKPCSIWKNSGKCPLKSLINRSNNQQQKPNGTDLCAVQSNNNKCIRIRYLARKMILATGNSSFPIMLNIPGENFQFVIHSLDQLDGLIKSGRFLASHHRRFRRNCRSDGSTMETVLVIGSGLSAADAITTLTKLKRPIRIVHIFRRSINDRQLIFNQLDNANIYPDYQKVYHGMKHSTRHSPLCLTCFGNRTGQLSASATCPSSLLTTTATNNSNINNQGQCCNSVIYQAYDRCQLTHLSSNRIATLEFLPSLDQDQAYPHHHHQQKLPATCSKCHQPLSHQSTLKIGLALILVGSKPELDFLSEPIRENLGRHRSIPIDTRHNPISIDTTTHQSISVPNLYAIGPLVGDNFVRFVQGGALAVASHIVQQKPNNQTPIVNNDNCEQQHQLETKNFETCC